MLCLAKIQNYDLPDDELSHGRRLHAYLREFFSRFQNKHGIVFG